MGYELSYQAMPAGCGLVERARSDTDFGGQVELLPYWFTASVVRPTPGNEGRVKGPLWDFCCELVGRHPELGGLHCRLDRFWDRLHYLLSATRRGEPSTPADRAVDRAFDAGDLIADHVHGGQGVPVRYLPTASVREVAAVVGPMSHTDLAAHFRPPRMQAAHVYKLGGFESDEAEWRWITRYFDEFRGFFMAAAAGDYVVLVVKD